MHWRSHETCTSRVSRLRSRRLFQPLEPRLPDVGRFQIVSEAQGPTPNSADTEQGCYVVRLGIFCCNGNARASCSDIQCLIIGGFNTAPHHCPPVSLQTAGIRASSNLISGQNQEELPPRFGGMEPGETRRKNPQRNPWGGQVTPFTRMRSVIRNPKDSIKSVQRGQSQ